MTSLKKLIAGSLLAAAAAVAPAHAFDFASGGTGNSSLVLTVFDQVAGTSLMVDLGLNYLDFSNNATSKDGSAATDVTPDSGYSLSFNIDLSIFGENNSNMEYTIFAADAQGTFANTETLVSADPTLGTFSGTNGDILNISNVAYTTGVAGQCNNALMTTVCTATNFGATGVYVGGTNWGDNFQYLDVNGSASVGTTLGMYGLNRTRAC